MNRFYLKGIRRDFDKEQLTDIAHWNIFSHNSSKHATISIAIEF